MANWSFTLTDQTYTPVGEVLNASQRQVAFAMNKVSTASFTVRLSNPLASYLFAPQPTYLKIYRNGTLMFFGPIVATSENAGGDAETLQAQAAGIEYLLAHRMVGKTAVGTNFTTPTDRALIVKSLIDMTNTENETGIDTTQVAPTYTSSNGTSISSSSAITYTGNNYKPLGDALNELSNTFDGFDWRIVPIENFVNGVVTGPKIGRFEAYPVLGIQQPEAVFEYGVGRNNILSYVIATSRDTQANQVFHLPEQGPTATGYDVKVSSDATSIATWKLMEDVATADLLDATLRQRLTDQNVSVRKNPRQTIEVQPVTDDGTARVPQFGATYFMGDQIRARLAPQGALRMDAYVRMWGATVDLSTENTETTTLLWAAQ